MPTTSFELTDEQLELIQALARDRMAKGKTKKYSASAIIREAIENSLPAFREELEDRK